MPKYGKEEIVNRFKGIDSKLSPYQKKAVNHAFKEIGYDADYVLD